MVAISIIGCTVGIITCIVGVSTFTSAQISKAKQDGVQIAKLDQCIKGIDELKKNMKEKNSAVDSIIDQHSKDIIELQTQVKALFKQFSTKN